MAFAHIIIKAIIASASLYIIIKPSYDSYCRSPAISSSDPPPAAALALPGLQVGGWGRQPLAASQGVGGVAQGEGDGDGDGEGEGEMQGAGKRSVLVWIAHYFGVSRDMFMRMGAPAGTALAADIWLSGVALRHVPMSV
jgi:hypothetical protein